LRQDAALIGADYVVKKKRFAEQITAALTQVDL